MYIWTYFWILKLVTTIALEVLLVETYEITNIQAFLDTKMAILCGSA